MKRVVILSGPPGSGKSTWAAQHYPDATVCSADNFFTDEETGEYNFDPSRIAEAHAMCQLKFLLNLQRDDGVIVVDNTNIRYWERATYDTAARIMGWEVQTVLFVVRTLEQVKTCADRNVHGVPRDVVARMALDHENNHFGVLVERIDVGASQ